MSRALLLLIPALVLQAQDSDVPRAVEVRPGIYILRGLPDEDTCAAIKRHRISHVIDLRRDGEDNRNCQEESTRLNEMGVSYLRYAIGKEPPDADFDFLRNLMRDLPRGARVIIHCTNGNRAAAAVCPWLVLDKGMSLNDALRAAKKSGLQLPETEQALRRYLKGRGIA